MQFLVRDGKLNMVTTMRSHDIVLGFTYDVFTFSMVAKSVQLLLKERGIDVELGDLYVTAGSLHLYSNYYEKAENWLGSEDEDQRIAMAVYRFVNNPLIDSYDKLINSLRTGAQEYGESL